MNKLVFKTHFLIITLFLCVSASACEYAPKAVACGLGIEKGRLLVIFPLVKERKIWTWFKHPHQPSSPEYGWALQTGRCVQGSFVGNPITLAAVIYSAHGEKKRDGSLDKLLASASILGSETQLGSDGTQKFEKTPIDAKVFSLNKNVALGISNSHSVELLRVSESTHAKLVAKLPHSNESYECVSKIERLDEADLPAK